MKSILTKGRPAYDIGLAKVTLTVRCGSLRVGGLPGDRIHVPRVRYSPTFRGCKGCKWPVFSRVACSSISPLGCWANNQKILLITALQIPSGKME